MIFSATPRHARGCDCEALRLRPNPKSTYNCCVQCCLHEKAREQQRFTNLEVATNRLTQCLLARYSSKPEYNTRCSTTPFKGGGKMPLGTGTICLGIVLSGKCLSGNAVMVASLCLYMTSPAFYMHLRQYTTNTCNILPVETGKHFYTANGMH